jgi:polyisoprenoid-binding protein YceI
MTTLTHTRDTLPAGTWQADPVHSHVGFELGYATGTFRGSFAPFEARLDVSEDGDATLTGQARADSVRVLDDNLAAHLLSPDFFDAERAPLLEFASREIRRTGAELAIAGELRVKGVAVPVELLGTVAATFAHPAGGERLPLHLETTVDRRAFGIDWNMELPTGEPVLANEVTLTADLFLVRS